MMYLKQPELTELPEDSISSTELMATYMYKESFSNFNMGYGSAVAGGMFILISMIALITMKLINGKKEA